MSKVETNPIVKTTIKTKCIHCGEQFDFDVYPMIDLQKDTDLYEDLFSLNLFKKECPKCKKLNILQYNTLVVDRFKKYMVYLFQPDQYEEFKKDINQYVQYLKKSQNKAIQEVLNGLKHTRVVLSLNDMLEKLLIYDYDLNDKIIELLKRGLYENKLIDQNEFDCIVFNKIDKDKLSFSCFGTSKDKVNAVKDITVDLNYYNSLIDALGDASKEQIEVAFPLINKQWAKNIISLTKNNA